MSYLDHIDPGNAGGSVVIPATSRRFQPKPFVYLCPECENKFSSAEELGQHRQNVHPIKRPYIYIKGIPLKSEETLKSRLEFSDITFDEVEEIILDGEKYKNFEALINKLICKKSGSNKLVLRNRNYPAEYRLHYDIPDVELLDKADKQFQEIFSSNIPLVSQLELFSEKVVKIGAANTSYVGGLGCYVTAIMAKDMNSESAISYSEYISKLGEAKDKLTGFGRPLSESIVSIIDFMSNDFRDCQGDKFLPMLSSAKDFYQTGNFKFTDNKSITKAKIPIDNVTGKILDFCNSKPDYQLGSLQNIEKLYRAPATSSKDKLKLAFILWTKANENNDLEVKRKYQTLLVHIHPFGELIRNLEGMGNRE